MKSQVQSASPSRNRSDKASQQMIHPGNKSTLMVLTKKDDTGTKHRQRNTGGLDASDRSAKSDGFMPTQQHDARRGEGMRYTSSADNLAEMIAISRQSLLTGGSSSGNLNSMTTMKRQSLATANNSSGGQRNFDRRNTYRESSRQQPVSREGAKPRKSLQVLTKMDGNKSSRSIGSVQSDGYTFPTHNENDERRTSVNRGLGGRRSSSYDNISDLESRLRRRTSSTDDLADMMAMPRQSNTRPQMIQGGGQQQINRRSTIKALPRNKSSDDLQPRRVTVPANQPLMGKETGIILTKKDANRRGFHPRNSTGGMNRSNKSTDGLDRSNRSIISAKSDGYLPGISHSSTKSEYYRKRNSSFDDMDDAMDISSPPLEASNGNARVKRPSARAVKGDNGNSNHYENVLMDLFSSIAAPSHVNSFKNEDFSIRSNDEELDQAFSKQNSHVINTPSPNAGPKKPPFNINTLIDQTQMPLTSKQPNSKPQHKRSNTQDAVAPLTQRQNDQPLKRSNPKPAPDNSSEMATGDNSVARKEEPHTQTKNNQDIKLYDELSQSSDPKIGKWIGVPDGTTTTEPDQSFLMRSASGGFKEGLHPYEMDERISRCSKCRPRTKFFIVGLLLVLAGLGIGGYFWFFHAAEEETDNKSSDVAFEKTDESPSKAGNNTSLNQIINETVILPPPADIEARCSASNLPGSLAACLSACLPSACCYPDFTGEACSDNAGCSAYKPHCDTFYDAWMGSTEGILRAVTDEMMNMCTGTYNIIIDDSSSPVSSSADVKRLRGHSYQRDLQMPSYQETCEQFCIAAKCCTAPTTTDLDLSDVIVSPTGVYTNLTSGDYVMTNCQESNSKNIPRCARYEAFCSTDAVPDQESPVTPVSSPPTPVSSNVSVPDIILPIVSPSSPPTYFGNQTSTGSNASSISTSNQTDDDLEYSNNLTVSLGNSSQSTIPSESPTMTVDNSSTTIIVLPSANSQQIQEACTDAQAVVLIATGDAAARSKCIKACQYGLCCFPDQLGYSWMDSCFQNNTQTCTEYSPCLVLAETTAATNSSEADWVENATIIVGEDGSNETIIENTTINVTSDSALVNSTLSLQEPVLDTNSTIIANETTTTNQTTGPTRPEQDLATLCSEESLSQILGLTQCLNACSLGSCCIATDETECLSTHVEICYLYTPCYNAYNLLYSS